MADVARVDAVIGEITDLFRTLETRRAYDASSADLTSTEYRALARAASTPNLTPKRLSESLGMSTAAVTAVADRLVSRSLLERVSNPADRRSVVLVPTAAGRTIVESAFGSFTALVADAIADVPEDCIDEVTAVLSRITRAMRDV